jgi:hypothetical protein
LLAAAGAALFAVPLAAQNAPPRAASACDPSPLAHFPQRPANAATGSEFAHRVQNLSGIARDELIRSELLAGNFPDFLRHLVPVTLAQDVTVCVLPDYLAVGSDKDFVFVPMGLEAALEVAQRFGFELPTPKIVDAIYAEAPIKLHPQPLPAGDTMRSTAYFVEHNEMIEAQRAALAAPLGMLTSGHKKDLVLTNRLWQIPGRVAIYGWHVRPNAPIQPLSTVHGARYADYSHGVRLVSSTIYVDGQPRKIEDALGQPALARFFMDDGPLPQLAVRLTKLMASLERSSVTAISGKSATR